MIIYGSSWFNVQASSFLSTVAMRFRMNWGETTAADAWCLPLLYSGLRDHGDDMGGWHLKLFIHLSGTRRSHLKSKNCRFPHSWNVSSVILNMKIYELTNLASSLLKTTYDIYWIWLDFDGLNIFKYLKPTEKISMFFFLNPATLDPKYWSNKALSSSFCFCICTAESIVLLRLCSSW